MKTRKAITKRIKVTKNKKMARRPSGQNHFQARKSGNQKRKTHGQMSMSPAGQKLYLKAGLY